MSIGVPVIGAGNVSVELSNIVPFVSDQSGHEDVSFSCKRPIASIAVLARREAMSMLIEGEVESVKVGRG